MDPRALTDIMRRLNALERSAPHLRIGTVTDTGPLSVALGGASTPYVDVRQLAGAALSVGDRVAVLVAGGDLLVLGAIA
jgi:hypothetical protein